MNLALSAALNQQLLFDYTTLHYCQCAMGIFALLCHFSGTIDTFWLPMHATACVHLLKLSQLLVAHSASVSLFGDAILRMFCTVIPSMGLEAAFAIPFATVHMEPLFSLDLQPKFRSQTERSNRNESTFKADGSKCTRFNSRCFLFVFSWICVETFFKRQHKVIL